MTNTIPTLAVITLPARPDYRASREAWIEHARIVSEIIRREPLGTGFDDELGARLTSVHLSWAREVSKAALAALPTDAVVSVEEWRAVLGWPESVSLSEDGLTFRSDEWCGCGVDDTGAGTDWVYVERWEAVGRVFHGFVCEFAGCRRLKQTG